MTNPQRTFVLTALLLRAAALAAGQDGAADPAGAQDLRVEADRPVARCAEEYRVGAGDVLAIAVPGNEELTRTAPVRTDGTVSFPLVGEVAVVGSSPSEIASRLAGLLARFLVNPQVDVQVREYNSRFVTLFGEVGQPGRRALRGCTRVIDVLLQAGGFRDGASGEVVVSRVEAPGSADGLLRARVERGIFTPSVRRVLETVLRDGDIITVLPRAYVTVQGEVARPNRYAIEGRLTVAGAVALAGGTTRSGAARVKVVRVGPDGKRQVLEADLKAIRDGRAEDFTLQPDDMLTVPRRFF